MSNLIESIWNIVKDVKQYHSEYKEAKEEQRRKIANYFDNIGIVLKEVHTSLEHGQYPSGKCGELAKYAELLPSTVGKVIPEQQAQDLARRLDEAHAVEELHAVLDNISSSERDDQLKMLLEAAGELEALSNSLRAGYH